ncbi:predicted protein [Lodderomyces elongisporus NRRL YB-4239]|uniref:26S proteasome complex subunit SEM1 n=1 Tax=Lodderomyces elongisporus (strain ATCC 11503 / CBS 2605 / JCM 1781 / NBRC 1676 / NRRL YB-4239) TaxID=379508 RepID=A5DUD0_LODEL|nr:predicted protein [Lodderomyces elongisporus NRRL YB-4239]
MANANTKDTLKVSAKEEQAQAQVPAQEQEQENKAIKTLEEDDEFEDFPEDENDWVNENKVKESTLWEEDWDDEDDQDAFSQKLKEELIKAQKAVHSS